MSVEVVEAGPDMMDVIRQWVMKNASAASPCFGRGFISPVSMIDLELGG
jgi:hypothetical protein